MIDLETRYRAVVHYTRFESSLRKVSKLYGVTRSSLQRWAKAALNTRPRRRKRQDVRRDALKCIRDCLDAHPFTTVNQLLDHVVKTCNLVRARSTVSRYIRKAGYTHKKAYRVVKPEHSEDKIAEFCEQYKRGANTVICIDEAGFYAGESGRFGYSPRGKRLNVLKQKRMATKYTLLMAVSASGVVGYEILNHNCKKADFLAFINKLDVKAGTSLVMDNIAFHHSKEVKAAIKQKECVPLYTLSYSPRCNTIEMVFSALKRQYRANCPPHYSGRFDYRGTMVSLLDAYKQKDLSAYFQHTLKWVTETAAAPHTFVGHGV